MNKQGSERILEVYGRPVLKTKNGTNIIFARQGKEDVNEIEEMSDKDLIQDWKGLIYCNDILGCVSLGDLQRIDLLELEMSDRITIDTKKLKVWYNQAKEENDGKPNVC